MPHTPVLWSEGMFLRPQHLQQESLYHEGLLEARAGRVHSYLWGFLELEFEDAALALGKLGLARARGVFPDGTPFDLPGSGPLPANLEPPAAEREGWGGQLVYLALPMRKEGVPLVAETGQELARLRKHTLELPDRTAVGTDVELVQVGLLNARLLLERDRRDDYAYLAVARISEVRGDGQIVLDAAFVPPSLDTRASKVLRDHLTALQGLIQYHADTLARLVVTPGRGGVGELSEFLKLQVLNRYEPLFQHFAKLDLLHPESLYRAMLCLLGDLVTFTERSKRGGSYPVYNHELPEVPFLELMDRLREAFSVSAERRALQLDIVDRAYGIRTVAIPDAKLVTKGRFVLAAKGPVAPERLGAVFPAQVKVAPINEIAYLVRQNLTGIPINLVPQRPEEIPYHEGFVYFGLDRHHKFWKEIGKSSEFAFHISGDAGLELEMWVIKEDE